MPTLAVVFENLGYETTLLDIDDRFKKIVKGYQKWDIKHPQYLKEKFDLIVADPPFSQIRTGQIKKAIEMLAHYDYHQKILISYFTPRKDHLLKIFQPFNLKETGFYPVYKSIPQIKKTKKGKERRWWVEFFSNFEINTPKE